MGRGEGALSVRSWSILWCMHSRTIFKVGMCVACMYGARRQPDARTADLNGCLELQEHWLVHEDLARACAETPNLQLSEIDLLARP